MLCSFNFPPYCSPSEAELDPPRPMTVLWIFIGVAENRTRPYKDITFYHELSKHNTGTRGVKQTLFTHCTSQHVRGDARFVSGLLRRWQALLPGDRATRQRGATDREGRCIITATRMGVTSSESQETVSRASQPRCAGCTLSGIDNSSVYIQRGGTLRSEDSRLQMSSVR